MTFWTDLVDAAVLGAGRAAPPSPPPSIASLSADGEPDGAGLLRLAAVASRARRACYSPAAATDLNALGEAPPDDRPGVSVTARLRLAGLLADEQEELVAEWLRLLAGTGHRPPEARLPDLLWRAANSQQIREALIPVLGSLGPWLAAMNPKWEWAVAAAEAGPPDLGTWTTASHRTRREMLAQVRRTDPEVGRELVAATWQGDSPRDRTAFIAGLEVGLSTDDEPLLDRALADGRGEVRQAAADLLAKLPGSAFSKRAAARAAAAVQVRKALLVTPPAEATQEMIADGIDVRPPRGAGLQAWLLRQVTAAAPAAWWTEHTGLPPADLLAISAPTPWAAELENGWTESAMRDAHVPWLNALLGRPRRQADEMATALLKALPAAERDSWLAAHPESPLFAAIELAPAPWSAKLSAAARDRVVALAVADPGKQGRHGQPASQTRVRRLLRVAAARLDPPAMPELNLAEIQPPLANAWGAMMNTLSIRAAMRRELAEEPTP
jgi:hypothetical protein